MTVISTKSITGVTSITSPQSDDAITLHTNDTTQRVSVTTGGMNVTGVITATSFDAPVTGDFSIADKIIHTGDTNTALRFPAADTITAETGGTERIRIGSTGLVGVGTDNPSGNLHIQTTSGTYDPLVIERKGSANWGIKPYANILYFRSNSDGSASFNSRDRFAIGWDGTDARGGDVQFYGTAAGITSCLWDASANRFHMYDDVKLSFGAANDLDIYHTTSGTSWIRHGNTSEYFVIEGDQMDFRSYTNSHYRVRMGTAVELRHNNIERLKTSSTGVTITGDITTSGTTKVKSNSVGIGTTTTTGVNAGVSTAYGEMVYNSTTNNVQVYTTTNLWYNVSDLQGYYKTAAAASSDGMNHYWGGSSSTSIISGLTPSGSADGAPNTPTVGHTSSSYYGDYPYFDFANGNDQVGYQFTKSGTKWGAGPFTICFWVDVQGVTMESESTYVQLGSHSGLRSLYTVSVDEDRKLKAITIGDDTGVSSDAQLIGNTWQHVAVTYNTSRVTKYYINGSLVRSHTHSSALDVGTSSQYIYLGYGYWNAGAGNKAAIAHMSDIGIWDAKELNATEILNIYNAKRIIRGY